MYIFIETPEAPGGLEIEDVGSRWINVTHYVVQFREEDGLGSWGNVTVTGSATSARINSLRPAVNYVVRLLAVNEVGSGPPTDIVSASTLQEGKIG